jgi:Toluene-4-monooxygenase system protein B (TmoB)
MLVPLYGFLQGDTIGLLVLVHDTDTVAEIARKLQQAAAVRLPPTAKARVYYGGHQLAPELTVTQAGLSALERVDVIQEAE